MKKGILSIIISVIGFYLLYRFNLKWYQITVNILTEKEVKVYEIDELLSFHKLTKIMGISIALLSFYLGMISFIKKNKIGLVGLLLSIVLCISSCIPFWRYVLEDSALDINVN